jgi:CRP-like cAMP-binding protein
MSAETTEFLKHIPLFQGLDHRHLGVIAKTAFERSFQPGDTIVKQGEQGLGMYMIRSGEVEVIHRRGDHEERLATLGKGDVFGELALLTDFPRSASVRATEPTTCLVLTAWNVRAELEQSAEMANHLLKVVARRLAELEQRVAKE